MTKISNKHSGAVGQSSVGRKMPDQVTKPTPRRRTQAERRASTSQAVIEATIRLIVEEGVARTTVSAIVQESGVSWGATQNLFGNKHDLLIAICHGAFVHMSSRIKSVEIDRAMTLEDRVRMILIVIQEVYDEPLMIAANLIFENPPTDSKAHDVLQDLLRSNRKRMDSMWFDLFCDLDVSINRVTVVRHFVQMTLDSLARHKPREDPFSQEWRIPSEAFIADAQDLLVAGIVAYLTADISAPKI